MVTLKWLPEALDDFDRLYLFLQSKDASAAKKAATCILRGADLLRQSPQLGRPMQNSPPQRELFVAFGAGAYVLRYRLENEQTVVVVRVWHSREDRTS